MFERIIKSFGAIALSLGFLLSANNALASTDRSSPRCHLGGQCDPVPVKRSILRTENPKLDYLKTKARIENMLDIKIHALSYQKTLRQFFLGNNSDGIGTYHASFSVYLGKDKDGRRKYDFYQCNILLDAQEQPLPVAHLVNCNHGLPNLALGPNIFKD